MAGHDRAGLRAVVGVGEGGETPGRTGSRFTAAEGRRFGLAVGGAFLALGALLLWRAHGAVAIAVAGLGAVLLICGLAVPARLGPAYRWWMALARAISRVTTPILMGAVYFLLITPIGLLRRTLGGHPLRHPPDAEGYWADRGERRKSDLRRQF